MANKNSVLEELKDEFDKFTKDISDSETAKNIKEKGSELIDGFINQVADKADQLKTEAEKNEFWQNMKKEASKGLASVKDGLADVSDKSDNVIDKVSDEFNKHVKNINMDNINDAIKKGGAVVEETFNDLKTDAGEFVGDVADGIGDFVKGLGKKK
ncbi:MAG: hypothetical protein ACK5G7_06855 [Erysipelotrichaceae bacterium]